MNAIVLSAAQRRQQRAAAHHLDPVVMIGSDGLTPAVLREVDVALTAHGLIKLRVFSDDRAQREALLARLAGELGAAPVQHIGKLLVLWRPVPPKAVAAPDDRGPGPRLVKLIKFPKSPTHRPTVRKVRLLGNQRITAGGSVKRAKKHAVSPKKRALG